nr:hypothetical protein CFP56_77897 [Quercus suber]
MFPRQRPASCMKINVALDRAVRAQCPVAALPSRRGSDTARWDSRRGEMVVDIVSDRVSARRRDSER